LVGGSKFSVDGDSEGFGEEKSAGKGANALDDISDCRMGTEGNFESGSAEALGV
jgi:hypothetical protein